MQTRAGTPYFMPPEIIQLQSYGKQCDIWSLGCVLYMLVCGELPFMGSSTAQVFPKILECDYKKPTTCSQECIDLITKMICVDVNKRYTAN